jgi:hypothetical protein
MMKQEELAFIKPMSYIEASSVFLRKLRKAMAAAKKKKDLAASNANDTRASALEPNSGVGSEAQTSRDFSQLNASKRKAEELSRSDCPSESATRRPAPGLLFDDGPTTQGTTGELAAQSSRQLGPTEGGLAYAAVVVGHAGPQQPSGTHKPQAKGSGLPEPAVSSEAAHRRMSQGDMSGPLWGMPDGTTSSAHVVNTAHPQDSVPKGRFFIPGVNDTRAFLTWLRASCFRYLTAQLKAEKLMVVPSTADGFRATVRILRAIDGR